MLREEMITYLVVHCADTPDEACLRAIDIHEMHLGFGWDGAGYHHIICRDGTVEAGRPPYWQGAHVYGQNENSLGICLIGRRQFSAEQMNSLSRLLHQLKCRYPAAEIVGHRDIQDTHKTCPNFDVRSWWRSVSLLAGQTACVLPSVTGLYSTPPQPGQSVSALDTELLTGETVTVSGETTEQGFAFATAQTDGYQGWVKLADLGRGDEAYHANAVVCQPHSIITAAADVKSAHLKTLPFGARLMAGDRAESGFVAVRAFCDDGLILDGFAAEHHIQLDKAPRDDDWTGWAERFIGAPYKWGGRSAAGLDCSALVQLCLAASGFAVPRDTGPQRALLEKASGATSTLPRTAERGDLIFWDGHVAICVDQDNIIHANAYHHAVAIEPRQQAIERIAEQFGAPVAHIPASVIRHHL